MKREKLPCAKEVSWSLVLNMIGISSKKDEVGGRGIMKPHRSLIRDVLVYQVLVAFFRGMHGSYSL
jgi:hypothetical protein